MINKTIFESFNSQNACASVVVDNHSITARAGAANTEMRKLCLPNGHETSGPHQDTFLLISKSQKYLAPNCTVYSGHPSM